MTSTTGNSKTDNKAIDNYSLVKEKPMHDFRYISIVSVVPARCGLFKYQELVICDKMYFFFKSILNDTHLTTRCIAPFSDILKPIDNIFTIERDPDSPDLLNTNNCELFGLLLCSNTILFEVLTVPTIDIFQNDTDQLLMSFIINYDFTSGTQSKYAINYLFNGAFRTTVLVVNSSFDVVDRLNVWVMVKKLYKSLGLVHFDKDSPDNNKMLVGDYVLDNEYNDATIVEILKKYDNDDYRFYVSMGQPITEPENLIKLHGYVMKSESSSLLNPDQMTCEFFEHILENSTVATPDMADVLNPIARAVKSVDAQYNRQLHLSKAFTEGIKNMIGWDGPTNPDRQVNLSQFTDVVSALRRFCVTKKKGKYTIDRSTYDLLNLLRKYIIRDEWENNTDDGDSSDNDEQCNNHCLVENRISDNEIYGFVGGNVVDGKIMACEIEKHEPGSRLHNEFEELVPITGQN